MMERSLVVFSGGQLFFSYLYFGPTPYTILSLTLSLCFFALSKWLPFTSETKLLSSNDRCERFCYTTAYNHGMFEHTYRSEDPSTRLTSHQMFGRAKNYCTLPDCLDWLNSKRTG